MRFFRYLMRPTPVVLLVVAMQAALVLAQVHAEIHAHAHVHAPAARASGQGATVALACRAMVRQPDCEQAPRPERHQEHRPEHRNDCATCWSLATAASGVLPTPPATSLDLPGFTRYEAPLPAQRLTDRGAAHFRARGPPLS